MEIKKYEDTLEIVFSKNLMEAVHFIDFYFKDNSSDWWDLQGDMPDKWEHCTRVTIGAVSLFSPSCFCNRDFTVNEIIYMIIQLRKEEKTGGKEILREKKTLKDMQ